MNQKQLNQDDDREPGRLLPSAKDEVIRSYPVDKNAYVTEIPRETLKSLFYLVAGRPDSIKKSFRGGIVVTPDDVVDLNFAVQKKLEHFEIAGSTTSVTVVYSNNTTHEFGSWSEFNETDWGRSDETKSVTIKWDFLAKLPNYAMPQRHTATVQMLDFSEPSKLIRNSQKMLGIQIEMAGFSVGSSGIQTDFLDTLFPFVTCKIDFINPLLGNEFLNIVEKWHKARTQRSSDMGWLEFMRRRKQLIVISIRYLITILITLLACSFLHYFLKRIGLNETLKIQHFEWIIFWFMGTTLLLSLTDRLARYLTGNLSGALESINNSIMFNLTRGDNNKKERLKKENEANKSRVLWNLALSITVKIIASLVTTWLLTLKSV